MKDPSKIIKEFEKLPYKVYVRKRPKHEPTDTYFYIERNFAKRVMRADSFNLYIDPVRIEMTDMQHIPILRVCNSDKIK